MTLHHSQFQSGSALFIFNLANRTLFASTTAVRRDHFTTLVDWKAHAHAYSQVHASDHAANFEHQSSGIGIGVAHDESVDAHALTYNIDLLLLPSRPRFLPPPFSVCKPLPLSCAHENTHIFSSYTHANAHVLAFSNRQGYKSLPDCSS